MTTINLKTPISYYGGKQKMARKILSVIPDHVLYCEPFVGGGAIFFAKQPSPVEVLNDTNGELVNFYKTVKNDFETLEEEVKVTLHSREMHTHASVIYNYPALFSPIKRAWAVWVLCTQGFSSMLDGSFGYDKSASTMSKKINNNKHRFNSEYATRLEHVQVECANALYVIKSRDCENAFFYLDPPYFNSHCGHYKGYTERDFEDLLQLLCTIQGKFLLSSYPSDVLNKYKRSQGWHTWTVEKDVTVSGKKTNGKARKKKVEVLTANYPI